MTREYSSVVNIHVRRSLDVLADRNTSVQDYQAAMLELGQELGNSILGRLHSQDARVYLACTAEDADFLAAGIVGSLEAKGCSPKLACFWNQRTTPFGISDIQVAPIIRRYREPFDSQIDILIVVKSIISGACVVKTNLRNLIQDITPKSIVIAAPVIYAGAEESLKDEFEQSVYEKFDFLYFAKDDERKADGEVIPGIGGMVYDRLGFDGQDDKNRHMPKIVEDRMEKLMLSA
jgi:hypothetical protein